MIPAWEERELFDLLVRRYGPPDESDPLPAKLGLVLAEQPPAQTEEEHLREGLEAFVHDLCHAERFGLPWFFQSAPWGERVIAIDCLCTEVRQQRGLRALQDEERLTSAVEIETYRRLGFTPPWSLILAIQAPDAYLSIPEYRYELAHTLDRRGGEIHHHAGTLVARFNRWRHL